MNETANDINKTVYYVLTIVTSTTTLITYNNNIYIGTYVHTSVLTIPCTVKE